MTCRVTNRLACSGPRARSLRHSAGTGPAVTVAARLRPVRVSRRSDAAESIPGLHCREKNYRLSDSESEPTVASWIGSRTGIRAHGPAILRELEHSGPGSESHRAWPAEVVSHERFASRSKVRVRAVRGRRAGPPQKNLSRWCVLVPIRVLVEVIVWICGRIITSFRNNDHQKAD